MWSPTHTVVAWLLAFVALSFACSAAELNTATPAAVPSTAAHQTDTPTPTATPTPTPRPPVVVPVEYDFGPDNLHLRVYAEAGLWTGIEEARAVGGRVEWVWFRSGQTRTENQPPFQSIELFDPAALTEAITLSEFLRTEFGLPGRPLTSSDVEAANAEMTRLDYTLNKTVGVVLRHGATTQIFFTSDSGIGREETEATLTFEIFAPTVPPAYVNSLTGCSPIYGLILDALAFNALGLLSARTPTLWDPSNREEVNAIALGLLTVFPPEAYVLPEEAKGSGPYPRQLCSHTVGDDDP